ncbi:MAG: 3-hydroxybutyryl-CoA dehydrogenase, partial [Nocardioidaceae bacterium]|nr:3-hydroxybutyryl-CoA dehydrogenase [Nocardioidaceae bacterium]
MSDIEKVGIVGGGLMGSGIAEVTSRAGLDVVLVEVSEEAASRAQARVEESLRRAEKRGKLESDEVDTILGRITFSHSLSDLADRDLVVEAASEDEATKTELFRTIGGILE